MRTYCTTCETSALRQSRLDPTLSRGLGPRSMGFPLSTPSDLKRVPAPWTWLSYAVNVFRTVHTWVEGSMHLETVKPAWPLRQRQGDMDESKATSANLLRSSHLHVLTGLRKSQITAAVFPARTNHRFRRMPPIVSSGKLHWDACGEGFYRREPKPKLAASWNSLELLARDGFPSQSSTNG
ncbi:hypothetical protein VTG60DRAFT_1180 [Thermothelomyces hinnuleus]